MGLMEIEPGVYIGDLGAAKNILSFGTKNEHGITHVLTLMDRPIRNELVMKSGLRYRFIRLMDTEDEDILSEPGSRLFDGLEFVINAVEMNCKVLIHCHMGVSRSGTILVAYLIWKHSFTFDEALNYVERKEWYIGPNNGFKRQLNLFHSMLKDPKTATFLDRRFARTFCESATENGEENDDAAAGVSGSSPRKPPSPEPSYYRCVSCRSTLFGSEHVHAHVRRHQVRPGDSIWCEHQYLLDEIAQEQLLWLNKATVGAHEGKLVCPGRNGKCQSKLGQFDWSGRRCLVVDCGAQVRPWFHVNDQKVDKMPLRLPQEVELLKGLIIES